MSEPQTTRHRWRWISGLFVALIALIAGAVAWNVPRIERSLANAVAAGEVEAGVVVEIEGRDATLSGSAIDQPSLDRAKIAVLSQPGVRKANIGSVTIAADVPSGTENDGAPVAATTLVAVIDRGVVTLEGLVPDPATADAIGASAAAWFGEENITNNLSVDPAADVPSWLGGAGEAIAATDGLVSGIVTFDDDGVRLSGDVASDDIRSEIEQQVQTSLSGTAIDNQLQLAEFPAPAFDVAYDGTQITFTGALPTRRSVAAVETRAGAVYGSENVVSELEVAAVADPAYLDDVAQIFDLMASLTDWEAALAEGMITIRGSAPDVATLDGVAERISTDLGGVVEVDSRFEIDAASVAATLTELLVGGANFSTGSVTLSAEARIKLDQAIDLLLANPSTELVVEGHTDDQGGEERNQELSELRAQAVVDYLVAGGIDASRLSAVGFGETQPIADNSTSAGRAENRRIEFVVKEGTS